MLSDGTQNDMERGGDERCVEHSLCANNKVQPFEMGIEDSYVADADVSSHPSSPSSGAGGETADTTGSPLLRAAATDEEVGRDASPTLATPPLRPTHAVHPVRLSCSAPPGCSHGLLSENLVPPPDGTPTQSDAHAMSARTPRTSPSLRPATPTTARVHVPHTPPPELKHHASPKASAPPVLQARTPPAREPLASMGALDLPPPPSPLSQPLPLSATRYEATPPPVHSPPTPSPRALPVHEEEPDVCCICLEEYNADNPMFRGECRHHFHLSCLMEWKQRSNSCPMCCANTLQGVGELPSPTQTKAVDPAAAARQREIAQQDEAYAHQLQHMYLVRSQQRQQARQQAMATRVSGTTTPSRSPQMRPQRNITPLPPLTVVPRSTSPQASRGSQRQHARGGRAVTPASTTTAGTGAAAATGPVAPHTSAPTRHANAPLARAPSTSSSQKKKKKKQKASKVNRATPTQVSPATVSRPRSTSPAVHPQFHGEQRPRRRSGQNGCVMM